MERWEGAVCQVNRSGRADYWLRGDGGGWRAFRPRSAAARRLFAGPCRGVAHTVESRGGSETVCSETTRESSAHIGTLWHTVAGMRLWAFPRSGWGWGGAGRCEHGGIPRGLRDYWLCDYGRRWVQSGTQWPRRDYPLWGDGGR